MLKIVKMMSLYFLAATICEQTTMSIPPELLRPNAPIHHVMVSAYANHPKCTGSTQWRDIVVAADHPRTLWRRLLRSARTLPSNTVLETSSTSGSKAKLHVVSYQDSMPKHRRKSVDLLLPSIPSCIQFGRNPGVLVPLDQT